MRRLDLFALVAILAATLFALLYMGRGTIPLFDDWVFWTPGSTYNPGDLTAHYNGHAAVLTRFFVSVSTDIGGSDSYLLHRLWAYAMHLATLATLYFVAVPYIGRRLALIVIVPLTLMGLAWLHMVMPFSTIFQGPGILGLMGALLALRLETRRGDVIACLVLLASVFTATAGLAAIAAIVVWLLWSPMQLRRLWIVAVPSVLWLAWYIAFKPDEGYEITLLNDLSLVPTFVAEGLSNGIRTYGYLPADWSSALAAGLVVLLALVGSRRGFDRNLAAAVAGAIAFWGIIAVGRGPELRPDQLRYLYPDAAHVILIAVLAAGLAGVRSNRRTVAVAGVLAFAFFLPSFNQLRNTMQLERNESALSRGAIAAIDLTGTDRLDPSFNPIFATREDGEFTLERYGRALADGRSIGFSEEELAGKSERVRKTTDGTLVAALGIGIDTAPRVPGGCEPLDANAPFEVPSGSTIAFDNRGAAAATVRLRRFADTFADAGTVNADRTGVLELPRDSAKRPWTVEVDSAGGVTACRG